MMMMMVMAVVVVVEGGVKWESIDNMATTKPVSIGEKCFKFSTKKIFGHSNDLWILSFAASKKIIIPKRANSSNSCGVVFFLTRIIELLESNPEKNAIISNIDKQKKLDDHDQIKAPQNLSYSPQKMTKVSVCSSLSQREKVHIIQLKPRWWCDNGSPWKNVICFHKNALRPNHFTDVKLLKRAFPLRYSNSNTFFLFWKKCQFLFVKEEGRLKVFQCARVQIEF